MYICCYKNKKYILLALFFILCSNVTAQNKVDSLIMNYISQILPLSNENVYKSIKKLNRTLLRNDTKFYPFDLTVIPVLNSIPIQNLPKSINDIRLKTTKKGEIEGKISYINKLGTELFYYSMSNKTTTIMAFVGGEVIPHSFLNNYECDYLIRLYYINDKEHNFYLARTANEFLLIKTGHHTTDIWNKTNNSDSVFYYMNKYKDDDFYYQIITIKD